MTAPVQVNPLIRPDGTAKRYGIGNNKGGVGKSHFVARGAEELAARGYRVLVVDGDPQGNVSRMLGYNEQDLLNRPTINEVVLAGRSGCAREAVLPCGWDQFEDVPDEVVELAQRIDLIPGRFDYELRVGECAGHEPHSAMARHARDRLAVSLEGFADEYDYVLVDMPPSIGALTHMALRAVRGLVVPMYPDYDPIGGAVRMRDLVATARVDWEQPELYVAGYVINLYDPARKRAAQDKFLPHIRATFGEENLVGDLMHVRGVYADINGAGRPLRGEPSWRRRDRIPELAPLVDLLEHGQVAA